MSNFREEVTDMLDIFDAFGVSEEQQRYIISNGGVYFNFEYGTGRENVNRKLNPLKFARFLKFCQKAKINVNVEKLIYASSYDNGIERIVHSFDEYDEMSRVAVKKLEYDNMSRVTVKELKK